ncbi:hypothetical protein N2152v2_006149 [Parachlorella kessleri]
MAAALRNSDLRALREYVTAPGSQNQSDSTVRLLVTHSNLKAKFLEIRLDMHMHIDSVKQKLCFHTGTAASAMVLQLKDEQGKLLAVLSDDSKMLGFYSPYDGAILHVIDTDPTSLSANGWLEDTTKVEKYVMSEDEYNKRDNTYRKYKEAKLREDPSWTLEKELAERRGVPYVAPTRKEKVDDEEFMEAEASVLQAGSRCEVEGGRRGAVRYVGKCPGLPLGYWVGVQYDEPVGKNDGSVKGKRYFDCPQGYGAFVRPNLVKTGDYPPFDEDLFGEDDEI